MFVNSEYSYLTIILRARVGYEIIDSQRGAERRVGYNQLISNKREQNNCFIKNAPKIQKTRTTIKTITPKKSRIRSSLLLTHKRSRKNKKTETKVQEKKKRVSVPSAHPFPFPNQKVMIREDENQNFNSVGISFSYLTQSVRRN